MISLIHGVTLHFGKKKNIWETYGHVLQEALIPKSDLLQVGFLEPLTAAQQSVQNCLESLNPLNHLGPPPPPPLKQQPHKAFLGFFSHPVPAVDDHGPTIRKLCLFSVYFSQEAEDTSRLLGDTVVGPAQVLVVPNCSGQI